MTHRVNLYTDAKDNNYIGTWLDVPPLQEGDIFVYKLDANQQARFRVEHVQLEVDVSTTPRTWNYQCVCHRLLV